MNEMDDYRKFCLRCGWNDADYGCISPSGEDVYQCPLYMHYHPEEVKKFDEMVDKLINAIAERTAEILEEDDVINED